MGASKVEGRTKDFTGFTDTNHNPGSAASFYRVKNRNSLKTSKVSLCSLRDSSKINYDMIFQLTTLRTRVKNLKIERSNQQKHSVLTCTVIQAQSKAYIF